MGTLLLEWRGGRSALGGDQHGGAKATDGTHVHRAQKMLDTRATVV